MPEIKDYSEKAKKVIFTPILIFNDNTPPEGKLLVRTKLNFLDFYKIEQLTDIKELNYYNLEDLVSLLNNPQAVKSVLKEISELFSSIAASTNEDRLTSIENLLIIVDNLCISCTLIENVAALKNIQSLLTHIANQMLVTQSLNDLKKTGQPLELVDKRLRRLMDSISSRLFEKGLDQAAPIIAAALTMNRKKLKHAMVVLMDNFFPTLAANMSAKYWQRNFKKIESTINDPVRSHVFSALQLILNDTPSSFATDEQIYDNLKNFLSNSKGIIEKILDFCALTDSAGSVFLPLFSLNDPKKFAEEKENIDRGLCLGISNLFLFSSFISDMQQQSEKTELDVLNEDNDLNWFYSCLLMLESPTLANTDAKKIQLANFISLIFHFHNQPVAPGIEIDVFTPPPESTAFVDSHVLNVEFTGKHSIQYELSEDLMTLITRPGPLYVEFSIKKFSSNIGHICAMHKNAAGEFIFLDPESGIRSINLKTKVDLEIFKKYLIMGMEVDPMKMQQRHVEDYYIGLRIGTPTTNKMDDSERKNLYSKPRRRT